MALNIDRALVKSQAKQIITGNVLKLFLISFIAVFLMSGANIFSYSYNVYNNLSNGTDNSYGYSDFFNFGKDSDENGNSNSSGDGFDRGYFDDFNGKLTLQTSAMGQSNIPLIKSVILRLGSIVQMVFMPLSVTLMGLYIITVRGKRFTVLQEFEYVFKNLFDKNYFKKWMLCFLQGLIVGLLLLVFIFPGVIFYYKYYFAESIMTDNPEISSTDALKLSKKLTEGHKGELFALDLSFIGWFLLTIITCGLASIYTIPYYNATKALYYENFRIRAFQEGRVTAFDFMNDTERAAYYQSQNVYYQPPQNPTYGSGMGNDYYNNNV
ncbi:MAG: DUF975 family protein [Eubacterium sp.]